MAVCRCFPLYWLIGGSAQSEELLCDPILRTSPQPRSIWSPDDCRQLFAHSNLSNLSQRSLRGCQFSPQLHTHDLSAQQTRCGCLELESPPSVAAEGSIVASKHTTWTNESSVNFSHPDVCADKSALRDSGQEIDVSYDCIQSLLDVAQRGVFGQDAVQPHERMQMCRRVAECIHVSYSLSYALKLVSHGTVP